MTATPAWLDAWPVVDDDHERDVEAERERVEELLGVATAERVSV
jgi:hypothetical protein